MSDSSRRNFVKKAVYAAPVVLTLAAAPEYAKAGSINRGPPGPPGPPPGPPKGPPKGN